jgi:hypothetical protein
MGAVALNKAGRKTRERPLTATKPGGSQVAAVSPERNLP